MEHPRGGHPEHGDHEARGGHVGHSTIGGEHEGRVSGGSRRRRMQHSQQIILIAFVSPKHGQEEAVEDFFASIAEKVFQNEPECLRYKIHKDEKSNDLIIIESYRDQQAVQKHMKNYFDLVTNGLEGKLDKPINIIQTTPCSGFPSRHAGFDADDD